MREYEQEKERESEIASQEIVLLQDEEKGNYKVDRVFIRIDDQEQDKNKEQEQDKNRKQEPMEEEDSQGMVLQKCDLSSRL